MCYLTIPPQIVYHKYYDDMKVRPSLPNFPSNNIPSTVAKTNLVHQSNGGNNTKMQKY
jgi:hypothetical protein